MDDKKIEEILEEIWIQREKGEVNSRLLCLSSQENITETDISEMEKMGYFRQEKEKICLTEIGEARALQIIRGHRLAERLMTDVLAVSPREMETSACSFEHVIQHELADAICTLLGHPKECPHGRNIPAGPCCKKAGSNVESVVIPLSKLIAGSRAKVAYITSMHYPRLDRLASLGILPGADVTLHQTKPSYIIQIGNNQIALDKEILKDIYVRKSI